MFILRGHVPACPVDEYCKYQPSLRVFLTPTNDTVKTSIHVLWLVAVYCHNITPVWHKLQNALIRKHCACIMAMGLPGWPRSSPHGCTVDLCYRGEIYISQFFVLDFIFFLSLAVYKSTCIGDFTVQLLCAFLRVNLTFGASALSGHPTPTLQSIWLKCQY